jgi:transposase
VSADWKGPRSIRELTQGTRRNDGSPSLERTAKEVLPPPKVELDRRTSSSNWLFCGSLRAGQRAAVVMSLIQSAKLNGHDPYVYLKDVRERLPTQPASRLEELPLLEAATGTLKCVHHAPRHATIGGDENKSKL